MVPQSSATLYPITIIGAGITGLSVAYHLQQLGIGPSQILFEHSQEESSLGIPGFIAGGCWDNFSRLSHARGVEVAGLIWSFGNRAYEALRSFCLTHKLPWQQGQRLRLICSKGEYEEASSASFQLKQQGFPTSLLPKQELRGFGPRVLAIQEDSHLAGASDAAAISRWLRLKLAAQGCKFLPLQATGIEPAAGQLKVIAAVQKPIPTELVVLAAHLQIGTLLPALRPARVPVTAQWSYFTVGPAQVPPLLQGGASLVTAPRTTPIEDGGWLQKRTGGLTALSSAAQVDSDPGHKGPVYSLPDAL